MISTTLWYVAVALTALAIGLAIWGLDTAAGLTILAAGVPLGLALACEARR